jgi:hypothetical protein
LRQTQNGSIGSEGLPQPSRYLQQDSCNKMTEKWAARTPSQDVEEASRCRVKS